MIHPNRLEYGSLYQHHVLFYFLQVVIIIWVKVGADI